MTITRRPHRGSETPSPVQPPQGAVKVAPRLAVPPAKPYSCGCGVTWGGFRTCHCSGCHLTWAGLRLFDAHRTRGGKCLPPEKVKTAERLVDGVWRGPERDLSTFGGE